MKIQSPQLDNPKLFFNHQLKNLNKIEILDSEGKINEKASKQLFHYVQKVSQQMVLHGYPSLFEDLGKRICEINIAWKLWSYIPKINLTMLTYDEIGRYAAKNYPSLFFGEIKTIYEIYIRMFNTRIKIY